MGASVEEDSPVQTDLFEQSKIIEYSDKLAKNFEFVEILGKGAFG